MLPSRDQFNANDMPVLTVARRGGGPGVKQELVASAAGAVHAAQSGSPASSANAPVSASDFAMEAAKWQQWMAGNAQQSAPRQDEQRSRAAPAKRVVPFQSATANDNNVTNSPISELAIEEIDGELRAYAAGGTTASQG